MKLESDELRTAAQVCFRSASELLEDALALESFRRYARATFLAFIGMEELGKAQFALELFNHGVKADAKELSRVWRSHEDKLAYAKGFFPYDPELLQRVCPQLLPAGFRDWFHYDEKKMQREICGACKWVSSTRPRHSRESS